MAKKRKALKRVSEMMAHRTNFLFAIVVFLFVVLMLRLAQMQLLNKTFYTNKLTKTMTYKVKNTSPRGKIYDASGVLLADTKIKEAVTFTRYPNVTANDLRLLTAKLATYVTFTETDVTEREKKDYYLADPEVYQTVINSLPDKEKYDAFGNSFKEATVYQHAVNAVTAEQINYPDEELKQVYIFSRMNATGAFDSVSLKTAELSAEQIAKVTASQELEGISVRSAWDRQKMVTSLSDIIGTVSSEKTGLPEEEAEAYLKKGYSLNDRIGTSYLEKHYESTLRGQAQEKTITVDHNGNITAEKVTQKGQSGKNLKLTVDLKFQKGVEDILLSHFKSELAAGNANLSEGAYAVVLDAETGAVLSMAGVRHEPETNQLDVSPLGTITEVFAPGSVVKGATLASGYENNAITGNQVLNDQPIQLSGSAPITSWFTSGAMPISAVQALEYSSNTYMVQMTMKMMGQEYTPGMILSNNGLDKAMTNLRKTYGEFGLGVSTGLDLPGESSGYVPKDYDAASVLMESFGQFDNYTTMQLAQYAATVGNGGKRVSPHLVEGIYEADDKGSLGKLEKSIGPNKLNDVSISAEDLSIIQQGFYDVVNSGSGYATGKAIGEGATVSISAKTGTAESYVTNKKGESVYTTNMNVVAYAPSQNPKIAVAVMLPHETDFYTKASHYMTRDIINLYNSLHPMN